MATDKPSTDRMSETTKTGSEGAPPPDDTHCPKCGGAKTLPKVTHRDSSHDVDEYCDNAFHEPPTVPNPWPIRAAEWVQIIREEDDETAVTLLAKEFEGLAAMIPAAPPGETREERRTYCHLCHQYFDGDALGAHGLGECVGVCERCMSTEPEVNGKFCEPCREIEEAWDALGMSDYEGEDGIAYFITILKEQAARASAAPSVETAPPSETREEFSMTEEQIKHMVDRFLQWRLPEHFNPDGGISFEQTANAGTFREYKREPVGTNLLDVQQAKAMVRYMVDGMPQAARIAAEQTRKDVIREVAKFLEDEAQLVENHWRKPRTLYKLAAALREMVKELQ